jgi:hypothetical protein
MPHDASTGSNMQTLHSLVQNATSDVLDDVLFRLVRLVNRGNALQKRPLFDKARLTTNN